MSLYTFSDYASARSKDISRTVTHYRQEQGWTQDDIAQQLHRSRAHINRIEHGKSSYTLEELEFLNALFGLPPGCLTSHDQPFEDLPNLAATNHSTGKPLTAHQQPILPPNSSQIHEFA